LVDLFALASVEFFLSALADLFNLSKEELALSFLFLPLPLSSKATVEFLVSTLLAFI
jgi:hypothetical protein